jgi:hypothetical protein
MRRLVPLAFLLVVCASAFAQSQPPKLTWLRFYQVAPGKDADFLRLLNDSSKATFDRLAAEKKVVGWGVAVPLTHTDEKWTHVVYVGLQDWAAAEALVKAVESSDADAKRSAADMKRLDELAMTSIAPGSVRDVLLHHLSQSDAPPVAKPKYIGVDFYTVKQGRNGDALALFNEWAKPMFGALVAKGKFGPWGFSSQDNMPGYTHMVWYFMSDLTALDESDAQMMAMEPMKLRGFDVRLRDLSEPDQHRMQLLRVVQSAP